MNGADYGSTDSKSTKLADVSGARREYNARDGCTEVLARSWVSLSSSQQESAGKTGHRIAEVPDCGFRAWVFLASASRLPICEYAEKQHGILESQIRVERFQGQEEFGRVAESRMAMPDDLGMRDENRTKAGQVGSTNYYRSKVAI